MIGIRCHPIGEDPEDLSWTGEGSTTTWLPGGRAVDRQRSLCRHQVGQGGSDPPAGAMQKHSLVGLANAHDDAHFGCGPIEDIPKNNHLTVAIRQIVDSHQSS